MHWQFLCHGTCCLWKPGEGGQDSTAGFGWVTLRTRHVVLDLQSVSSCPGSLASPQGLGCTQSAKGASSSETLRISDPVFSFHLFSISHFSSSSLSKCTRVTHGSYPSDCRRCSAFGHANYTGCAAAGDSQPFAGWVSVNFDYAIEFWTLVLQNFCLMCSDKVRELLMIFKKKREVWQCFECLSVTT